jgi:hypothetical protein
MYFKIIKSANNKTSEREFLDGHPLVRFIDTPMTSLYISDGVNVREIIVDVKKTSMDIVDRLKHETNIKNKMFVVYAPCENTVFYNITYDPFSFDAVKYIRCAEISVSREEWNYMMKDELKKREEAYEELLYNQNKSNKKYKYLLIGR